MSDFKTFDFDKMSLKATMRLNAVWFDYIDVLRTLKALSKSAAVTPITYQLEDESYKLKPDDITIINDSAVFRWIDDLKRKETESTDIYDDLDRLRMFITHSVIPTMYRDHYYAEQNAIEEPEGPRIRSLTYNDTDVKFVIRNGEFWFVIADIRKATGYQTHATQIAKTIGEHCVSMEVVITSGGEQNVHIISLAGLKILADHGYKRSIKEFASYVTTWSDGFLSGSKSLCTAVPTETTPVEQKPTEPEQKPTETKHIQQESSNEDIKYIRTVISSIANAITDLLNDSDRILNASDRTQRSIDALLKSNPAALMQYYMNHPEMQETMRKIDLLDN